MEKTGCKIICGAPTTYAVKGLMIMMMTMLSRHSVGTYQGNELTHNWAGNTHPQSSQLAELLWTDPGLKSGISVC